MLYVIKLLCKGRYWRHSFGLTVSCLFYKEVNMLLARRPLVYNGRLANRGLTSSVKRGHWWRYMATSIWLNIGSGDGLSPGGTKRVTKPMLIYQR